MQKKKQQQKHRRGFKRVFTVSKGMVDASLKTHQWSYGLLVLALRILFVLIGDHVMKKCTFK